MSLGREVVVGYVVVMESDGGKRRRQSGRVYHSKSAAEDLRGLLQKTAAEGVVCRVIEKTVWED